MAEPNKLEIQISTTGADSAVSEIKKVKEENLSLQEQLNQRLKGHTYDNPVFVDVDKAEAESRRAAAAASNAAAAEEAAAVRAERAAAKRSAAFAADAKMREEAAARHIAAVAAEAEADAAAAAKEALINEKRMGMLARRGAMMLGGSERAVLIGEEAGLALTGSSISMATAAAAPYIALAGAMAVSGAVIEHQYENIIELEKEAAQLGIKGIEDQRTAAQEFEVTTGRGISILIDSWKNGISNTMGMLGAGLDWLDGTADLRDKVDQERFNKRFKFVADNKHLYDRITEIKGENEALSEQERQLNRLVALNEKLNGQANTAARQEVELAKLKGGDVALAEANALATEMRTALDGLNSKLVLARQSVEKAGEAERLAVYEFQRYQEGVSSGAFKENKEEYEKLKKAVDDSGKKGQQAREALQDQNAAFGGAQKNILRKTEIDLEKKEEEYSGQTSTAAAKAFQKVYQSLKEEVAKGPTEAIAQIQVEVGTITTSANSKATEVKTVLDTERTGTVKAIQGLAPTPADSSALVAAVAQAKEAINAMAQNCITSIAQISAATIANSSKLAAQQAQISQLFARIR